MLEVSYCDHPVSIVHCPQFASNDISVTTGRISTKVDRIVPLEVLYQNCSNCSAPLHKMAARAKNRKKTLKEIHVWAELVYDNI